MQFGRRKYSYYCRSFHVAPEPLSLEAKEDAPTVAPMAFGRYCTRTYLVHPNLMTRLPPPHDQWVHTICVGTGIIVAVAIWLSFWEGVPYTRKAQFDRQVEVTSPSFHTS